MSPLTLPARTYPRVTDWRSSQPSAARRAAANMIRTPAPFIEPPAYHGESDASHADRPTVCAARPVALSWGHAADLAHPGGRLRSERLLVFGPEGGDPRVEALQEGTR